MIFKLGPAVNQQIVDISLPSIPTKIGVMVSGGADSAILLYVITMLNKEASNMHEIVTFTVARADGAYLYSPTIVGYINHYFQTNINTPHKVGNPDLHHSKQTQSGAAEAFQLYNIEHVFYGSQQTPPVEWPMPGIYPYRPSSTHPMSTVTCPFALVDKRHTMDLYKQLNQWELLKLTHSCTEMQIGRCNICFNCTERAWACNQLDIIDPGTK